MGLYICIGIFSLCFCTISTKKALHQPPVLEVQFLLLFPVCLMFLLQKPQNLELIFPPELMHGLKTCHPSCN